MKKLFLTGFLVLIAFLKANSAVQLLAPANNERCQDTSVQFIWSPVSGAISYSLTVSYYSDLSNPILDSSGITTTQVNVHLPGFNVQYYWKVTAILNLSPLQTDESPIWNFTTKPSAPQALAPSSNSSCNPLKVTFRWSSVNNAMNYRLQISNTNLFLTILKDTIVTSTEALVTVPNYNTKYYWRLSATTNYNCTTYYSAVDSFRTNRVPPTLLTPNDNVTSIWGDIDFSWNVPVNANSYNLQISTAPDFSIVLYDEITSDKNLTKSITDFNTRFYWRVKAVYTDCETDFSPVFTFLTAYDSPKNLYPLRDTQCISNKVDFIWDNVNGAQSYRLQVSPGMVFNADSLVVDTLIKARTFSYYFGASLQYYSWRVRAEDATNVGLWSDTMRFQTTFAPPKHISPANGTETSKTVVFKWTKDIMGSTFNLQVSDTTNFNLFSHRIFDLQNLTEDSIVLTLPHFNKVYYWRVQASDAYCRSDWSQPTSFKVKLQKPLLVFPSNNAIKMPLKVTFEWSKPEGAETYQIVVATDPQFRDIVQGRVGLTINKVTISGFDPSTKYYWRVRAVNAEDTSRWSDVYAFTTGPNPLEIPTLISPVNNSDNQPTTLRLVWSSVPKALYYQLQVARDLQFSQIDFDVKNIEDTTYLLNNLNTSTEYFWRVLAYNDSSTSQWSSIWRFRTVPPAPVGPVLLILPQNETVGVNVSLSLIWNVVNYAYYYHLQVATDPNFVESSLVVNDSTLLQPTKIVSDLEYNTQYFWHVRAYNPGGSTSWSDTWWFKTMVSSVEDEDLNAFLVFNPNTKELMINLLGLDSDNPPLKIEVLDLLGKVVFSKNLESENSTLSVDLANLSKGVYFVQITTRRGLIKTRIIL